MCSSPDGDPIRGSIDASHKFRCAEGATASPQRFRKNSSFQRIRPLSPGCRSKTVPGPLADLPGPGWGRRRRAASCREFACGPQAIHRVDALPGARSRDRDSEPLGRSRRRVSGSGPDPVWASVGRAPIGHHWRDAVGAPWRFCQRLWSECQSPHHAGSGRRPPQGLEQRGACSRCVCCFTRSRGGGGILVAGPC